MCRCLIFPYVVNGLFDRFLAVGRLALSGSRTLVRRPGLHKMRDSWRGNCAKIPTSLLGNSTIAYEGTGFPLKPTGSGCSAFFGTGHWTGKRLNTQGRPSLPFVHSNSRGTFPRRAFASQFSAILSWSRLIGQFGGLFKLFPGCIYAASLWLSIAGASPGNAEISVS